MRFPGLEKRMHRKSSTAVPIAPNEISYLRALFLNLHTTI